jgi:hypothetical protein
MVSEAWDQGYHDSLHIQRDTVRAPRADFHKLLSTLTEKATLK